MGTPMHAADPAGAAEAKLRENLRATMLQLRDAQNQRAAIEAEKADIEAKRAALNEELEALKKETAANQAESKKAIDDLNLKVEERDREIGSLRVSLEKWKVDHKKVTDIANTKENQRVKLTEKVIALDRVVADQRVKNEKMYELGMELLGRYERFGLGDALTAREPFVGVTRVKFQNLVQDYSDNLTDAKIKPDAAREGGANPGSNQSPSARSGASEKPKSKPVSTKPDSKPKTQPASSAQS
jgi:hypothetical protein